jgi:hypothetical protein
MAWFDSMGLKDDHTIKAYYYDIASEDPGIFNVDGIEKESRKLLEDLAGGKTEEQDPNRRYIFIALDIGGIIVKKVRLHPFLNKVSNPLLRLRPSSLPAWRRPCTAIWTIARPVW